MPSVALTRCITASMRDSLTRQLVFVFPMRYGIGKVIERQTLCSLLARTAKTCLVMSEASFRNQADRGTAYEQGGTCLA